MDFLLNELSLQGQFDSMDSFLKSLPCTVKCIELIHQNANMPIYKTEDFYKCSITQDMKLCDLKNYQISDELNFPNPSFFCKFFKRMTGMTPQEYQKSE